MDVDPQHFLDQSNGPWSVRCGRGAGGKCDEISPAGVRSHHAHQRGPTRCAIHLEDGDEHDCKASEICIILLLHDASFITLQYTVHPYWHIQPAIAMRKPKIMPCQTIVCASNTASILPTIAHHGSSSS